MLPRPTLLAILGLNTILLVSGLALPSPPRSLQLQWVRHLPALEPTWPDQPRFTSDVASKPVVANGLVLLTSSRYDRLQAIDRLTGQMRWQHTADGPIRFAPAVWNDRVFVVSDDGYLYCLDLDSGERLWRFRGGPSDRRVLGNERLISTWPARGGPVVVSDGPNQTTVYFAAGIWPFMGIFLHALDARTGEPRWQNSGEGSIYVKQPHQTDAFAGIAPQGSLVVAGEYLIVPGGRSLPAVFDRRTGQRKHYLLADSSKLGGGPDVVVADDVYLNGGGAFDLVTGKFVGTVTEPVAVVGTTLYSVKGKKCRAFDLSARPEPDPEPDAKDTKAKAKYKAKLNSEAWLGEAVASAKVPATTVLLAAHGKLYGASEGVVYALNLPIKRGPSAPVWEARVKGTPIHLSASDEQLFVSTREGQVYAFGPQVDEAREYPLEVGRLPDGDPEGARMARQLVQAAGVKEGYAVVCGVGSGSLITDLLVHTRLNLVVVDPNPDVVAQVRHRLAAAGHDGKRVALLNVGSLEEAQLPPYFASLVASENLTGFAGDPALLDRVWRIVRPHGGVVAWPVAGELRERLLAWKPAASEGVPRIEERDGVVLLRREGALPGAGDWTHEHADAANTRVSRDSRIRAPLGLLWFGGPGNQSILPRHGHGPVPQVCEGRLMIEGPDMLRAIDVYTGRLLWETKLPGVGKAYDNVAHQPGANALGSNYVSRPEGVYVLHQEACVLLDAATGKEVRRFHLPAIDKDKKTPPPWTFLTVTDRYLIGGSGLVPPPAQPKPKDEKPKPPATAPSRSMRLTVMERETGKVLFSVEAKHGFRHNAICVGGGRLYAIDAWTQAEVKKRKKGEKATSPSRLVVCELATGKPTWSREGDVFGTWLSYSEKHDVLVEAGLMSRDTLSDEPEGMRAYRGDKGEVLWHKEEYFGPALIHGDRILKGGDAKAGSGTACDLLTGKPTLVADPLTGEALEWKWVRTYGCNTPAASEHLVVFRSGAAGFYDLCNNGGTGNVGGLRSSCTLNMIAAGGVLTVPDYTRTCTCSYQNQCSLGLIHVPEAELWTFTTARAVKGPIRQVGINFGAPGGRKAENGTLWIEYPQVGGPSPKVEVKTVPARPETFRLHQSQVEGEKSWVSSSGMRGLVKLTVGMGNEKVVKKYTVRLHFLEPDAAGERVFDVAVQGKTVESGLDVRKAAGASGRGIVREYRGVEVGRELTIGFTARVGAPVVSGVEVIEE